MPKVFCPKKPRLRRARPSFEPGSEVIAVDCKKPGVDRFPLGRRDQARRLPDSSAGAREMGSAFSSPSKEFGRVHAQHHRPHGAWDGMPFAKDSHLPLTRLQRRP